MNKPIVGFLYSGRGLGKEEIIFLELAKEKGMELRMFNIFGKIDSDEFKKQIEECDIVYNNTAEDFVIEFIKMAEEQGKKVVDNSRLYYYTEDKWMFYIKCKEYGIPTLKTILLSENLTIARQQLKEFGNWPIVLKRVVGTMGEYVEKADNIDEAIEIMKKFWDKGNEKLPIIAQEFLLSPSYRITIIDNKIVQTAIKKSTTWKATGVQGKHFERFEIDEELQKLVKKVMDAVKISICGIDLMKRDNQWYVLEVNSEPSLDFFEDEQRRLVGLVLDYLKRLAVETKEKRSAHQTLIASHNENVVKKSLF